LFAMKISHLHRDVGSFQYSLQPKQWQIRMIM
jgi:hypothetical protein